MCQGLQYRQGGVAWETAEQVASGNKENRLFNDATSMHYALLFKAWLVNVEQLVELELAGETEVLRANFPECHAVMQDMSMQHGARGSSNAETWSDLYVKCTTANV
jgi:hypothetical protein